MQRQEERQALHVIPVEVRQERGAVDVALVGHAVGTQAGAEVEEDGRLALGFEHDARGVAAVPLELGAGARRRAPHPEET